MLWLAAKGLTRETHEHTEEIKRFVNKTKLYKHVIYLRLSALESSNRMDFMCTGSKAVL